MLDTFLEAIPPGRKWPSFRNGRALVIGGLRVRGPVVLCLSILWAALGAAGAGYDFILSTHVPEAHHIGLPSWVGEPLVTYLAGDPGALAWLLLTIPVLVAGLGRAGSPCRLASPGSSDDPDPGQASPRPEPVRCRQAFQPGSQPLTTRCVLTCGARKISRCSGRPARGTTAGNSGNRKDSVHVSAEGETYSDHGGSRASAEGTGGSDARIWWKQHRGRSRDNRPSERLPLH